MSRKGEERESKIRIPHLLPLNSSHHLTHPLPGKVLCLWYLIHTIMRIKNKNKNPYTPNYHQLHTIFHPRCCYCCIRMREREIFATSKVGYVLRQPTKYPQPEFSQEHNGKQNAWILELAPTSSNTVAPPPHIRTLTCFSVKMRQK